MCLSFLSSRPCHQGVGCHQGVFVPSSAVDNTDFLISCGQESRDQLGLSAIIAWQAICDVTAADHELPAVCSRAWQRVKQGRQNLMSSPIVHDPIVGFME